jgi:hypothetical protein
MNHRQAFCIGDDGLISNTVCDIGDTTRTHAGLSAEEYQRDFGNFRSSDRPSII